MPLELSRIAYASVDSKCLHTLDGRKIMQKSNKLDLSVLAKKFKEAFFKASSTKYCSTTHWVIIWKDAEISVSKYLTTL